MMSYGNDIDTLNGYTVEISLSAYGDNVIRIDIPDPNGEAEYHCMVKLTPAQAREIAAALVAAADSVDPQGDAPNKFSHLRPDYLPAAGKRESEDAS